MKWFIILIGIIWIILGLFGLVATKRIATVFSNLVKNTRRKTLGLLGLIFGVLLLLSASSAREYWFVFALGVISCLKGLTIVLISDKNLKAMMDWWLAAPEIVYKGWAAFALVLGIAMFYII
jgi:multisubunit Na+/H+ antiporter MnhG subunit